jgi:diguanylate cyclase (GGDEF)-like protein
VPTGDDDVRATLVTTITSSPVIVTDDLGAACLVVIYGADLGRRIPLGTQALECGRSMQTDIPLDDDAVSRKHARVAWTGSSFLVRDLGSTNGTYVNDCLVQEKTLKDGDRVKIGRTIFKFIYGGNVEASYHEEIYKLMTCDGLTQIHNRRSFEESLEREVSRSRRYQRILSLVMFDIDHFKKVNDTRGHLAGDTVLRQLAELVSAKVRREDIFARVGGEEFAILAPEVGLEGARTMAEKLRVLVQRNVFRFEDADIPITSSFGVACLLPGDTKTTASELYKLADERLYLAKNAGRNRVM